MDTFERRLWDTGSTRIAGIDEAGRGALAGPVVAAAVILPPWTENFGLRDSKKLTPSRRESLFVEIKNKALSVGIGIIEADEIDRINILAATLKAMETALSKLDPTPDFILIDGNQTIKSDIPQEAIVKGDDRSMSVAAASIIAKVTRDRLMAELHGEYPQYNFLSNKGYGTEEHLKAIDKSGNSTIHRKSFIIKSSQYTQLSFFSSPGPR